MHAATSIADSPERPRRPAEPQWSDIPPELIRIPRWVLWRYEMRSGRWTKVPVQPDGSPASSTDAATWAPFGFVETAFTSGGGFYDGVGTVLNGDGLIGFDFDHCVGGGRIVDPKIENYVHQLDSYTEVSPSGTGLRVFLFAKLPPDGRKAGGIECYETGRYLTVTGCHYPHSPRTIYHHQDAVAAVHASVFAERIAMREAAENRPIVKTPVSLADSELLERARKAKNGADFIALYGRGGWKGRYPSQSEADLALCTSLAFWCGPDPNRIDRLFRSSALMREKWERADYRDRTIAKAIEGCGEVYSPEKALVNRGTPASNSRKADEVAQEESPRSDNGNDSEEALRPPQFSDDALALHFAKEHAARLRYVAVLNDWLEYDGACWHPDRTMRTSIEYAQIIGRLQLSPPKSLRQRSQRGSVPPSQAIKRLPLSITLPARTGE